MFCVIIAIAPWGTMDTAHIRKRVTMLEKLKAHYLYLKYVLRHKLFVYQEGVKLGVGRWQLLKHDMSKFSRAEWTPYVLKFYGKHYPRSSKRARDHKRIKREFDLAWLHHQHSNPHHWQRFVLLNDFGNPETCLEMPERYMLEMIADWKGAGRAKHGKHTPEEVNEELQTFYQNTARYRKLHDITKMKVENIIGVKIPSPEILQA